MAIQKTSAIVLKTQPFRSTSLIVTFFSSTFGKLRGLVKGVRQEREMRGAIFELFTNLDIVYYEKTRSDLHLVSEASISEDYNAMRGKLDCIATASYFAELTDLTSEVHDPHEKIFELLDFSYRYLAALPPARLSRLFEIKLLNEIGWLPYLEGCITCQAPLERGYFSMRQGTLLCPNCAPAHPDAKPLDREPLAVMRYYIHHDLDASIRFPMTRQTEKDLEVFMSSFLLERLGKPLKSRIFFDKISPVLSL